MDFILFLLKEEIDKIHPFPENPYNLQGMIYLDYSANAPVRPEVLETLVQTESRFPGNVISLHPAGEASRKEYERLNQKALQLFGVEPEEYEIVYTSSASESNNLAIKGVYESYKGFGRHILASGFEHSSVNAALGYLKESGAEVEIVDTNEKGEIDFSDLHSKLRKDTILLCLNLLESETGTLQPYREIEALLKAYPNCHFLLDATQAIGKIRLDLRGIELLSCAPHKFGGIAGTGFLLKKKTTVLTPLIHGGVSVSPYRSGTAPLGLIASSVKALELAQKELDEHYRTASKLHALLVDRLRSIHGVLFNSPTDFPYILNISLSSKKASATVKALADKGICVSQKSACSIPNTPSKAIMAIYHDKNRALSSFRISLSYQTTKGEIEELANAIKEIAHE